MNKVIKVALVVVILAGIGSLALTNKLAGIKKAQQAEVAKLSSDLKTTADKLASSEKNAQQTTAALGQTQGLLDRANADLQATRVTLSQRDQALQTAKTELAEGEKLIAAAKQKVAAAESDSSLIRKALKDAGVEDISNLEQLRSKLEAQAAENKILAAKLEQLTTDNARLKQQQSAPIAMPPNQAVPPNLRGQVSVVDSRWGFVVFDLGERDQVKAGSDFAIYRGNRLIGKLQVVTVGASTSVGQLLPEFESGEPRPGDLVVH